MAYFVAILTPNSARSCVMQSTLPTKGIDGPIISTVSISLKDFLPSILLLMVIIVAVVIVTVIWVVIFVNVNVGVIIVVRSLAVVVDVVVGVLLSSILSFVIIGILDRLRFIIGPLVCPPMKASISFSEFGTMFGHKNANSWNLLI
ncbi:hypothetical protein Tco_0953930 [Tanacetum coccineum]|uniref:Uncharacterized protein n=1 Tax=Tanacetum coccineum TaxID=301880 RepID=A0ABQ5E1A0_9ASTR